MYKNPVGGALRDESRVMRVWEEFVGHRLSAERRDAFRLRPEVSQLAEYTYGQLAYAAQRASRATATGNLRLTLWLAECQGLKWQPERVEADRLTRLSRTTPATDSTIGE